MICIGPLTFLICIDNLPAVFSNHYTNVNLFADDVLLYHLITDAMDYAVLQEAITLLKDWSNYQPPKLQCIQKELPNSPVKPVVSAWRPSAESGVLQITGLTSQCISLQLVLRPNRSLVCFTGASMALLAKMPCSNCISLTAHATP